MGEEIGCKIPSGRQGEFVTTQAELRLESLFGEALRSAERAADGDNIGDFEPEAVAFLDAVALASAHRVRIVEMLTAAALTARDTDLFEYLFHYMPWPELRSFVEGLRERGAETLGK